MRCFAKRHAAHPPCYVELKSLEPLDPICQQSTFNSMMQHLIGLDMKTIR